MEETTPPLTPKTPSDSAARRRARGRSLSNSISSLSSSSSSSSYSSNYSSSSTAFSSPCPSPFVRSWSAIPFSWEQRPGIPKSLPSPSPAAADAYSITRPPIPLPPPARRSHPRKTKSLASRFAGPSPNPFADALALCSRRLPDDVSEDGDAEDDPWGRRLSDGGRLDPRRVAAIANRFGLFGWYGSCKATCAVADATVRLPRSRSIGSLGGRSDPVRD